MKVKITRKFSEDGNFRLMMEIVETKNNMSNHVFGRAGDDENSYFVTDLKNLRYATDNTAYFNCDSEDVAKDVENEILNELKRLENDYLLSLSSLKDSTWLNEEGEVKEL